jgi:hypothetical protein
MDQNLLCSTLTLHAIAEAQKRVVSQPLLMQKHALIVFAENLGVDLET